jgi:hypothetical protein
MLLQIDRGFGWQEIGMLIAESDQKMMGDQKLLGQTDDLCVGWQYFGIYLEVLTKNIKSEAG